MPKYRITFNDGSTIEREAESATLAKQAAKSEAKSRTGAAERNDPRVKVSHVVNLDEKAGPTDPRNAPGAQPARPSAPSSSTTRSRDERERTERERQDRERQDRERDERERDEHDRDDRDGGR
jgi:hypothetical protein